MTGVGKRVAGSINYTVIKDGGYSFYEKRIVEIGFAATCSSTHKVFMHIIKDLKVCAIHSPANIWMVCSFFPCF
jgi:hypothetical protein